MYLKELKSDLQVGVVIVLCDFAENYSFMLQGEAQGFHWNNTHATLHPSVIYFQESPIDKLSHTIVVIISDCLTHDSTAVHPFQK
jgi:hypothetical protein